MGTAVIGFLGLILLPIGGVIIAGLLFPVLLIVGIPIYVVLAFAATVGRRMRN